MSWRGRSWWGGRSLRKVVIHSRMGFGDFSPFGGSFSGREGRGGCGVG